MIKNKRSEYEWGYMIWWLDGKHINQPDMSTAKMVLYPEAISEEHFHDNCFEFIVVNQGEVEVILNNIPNKLVKNDTFLIPPNSNHFIKNKLNEDADLTIVYSACERNYSTP